ncbi:OLC1v1018704C1 [Oldenlandia corymbosa var. corymbosa]|uniref:OLC1v1018704C1 n=1 Tax=Oldenlandia corymbosa var. corymbosa TaxID=529605 RepID=A0AAV1ECL5_OLDCO|nr:OLC1v1018704C1 [Oldenlandia corymbosa var. corymbosa]
MDEDYSTVDLITPLQDSWKIRVRLICVWKPPLFSNPNDNGSIEMVLMDHLRNKIHATVKKSLIGTFMGVISEGSFKAISHFGVATNSGNFRTTTHPYKINFLRTTQVRHCIDIGVSPYEFEFVSFSDLLDGKLDESCTIDIIGEVVAVGDLITGDRNGKPSRREVEITVTLWDDYAQNMTDYFAGRPGGCVVMIVQFARIRPWRGTNTVTNSLSLPDFSLIQKLMKFWNISPGNHWMVNAYGTDDAIRAVPMRDVSYLSTPSSISEPDDFLTLNPKKRIDDLQEVDESCVAVVVASIVSIESEYGWFYIACKKCNKKVNPTMEVGGLDGGGAPLQSYYYYNKCQNNVSAVVPRFRVQVRVLDDSGSTSFLLFDKDVYKCIRKTALHVREDMLKIESEDERPKVPKGLERLVGKKFIFKIEVSEYNIDNNWPMYTVLRMSSEMSIINAFESCSSVNQDVDADLDSSTTEERNITPKCLAGKDSINSCTGEVDGHNVQLMSTATSPLKRTLQFDEDDITLQSSSTKAKIEVKLEKF